MPLDFVVKGYFIMILIRSRFSLLRFSSSILMVLFFYFHEFICAFNYCIFSRNCSFYSDSSIIRSVSLLLLTATTDLSCWLAVLSMTDTFYPNLLISFDMIRMSYY